MKIKFKKMSRKYIRNLDYMYLRGKRVKVWRPKKFRYINRVNAIIHTFRIPK